MTPRRFTLLLYSLEYGRTLSVPIIIFEIWIHCRYFRHFINIKILWSVVYEFAHVPYVPNCYSFVLFNNNSLQRMGQALELVGRGLHGRLATIPDFLAFVSLTSYKLVLVLSHDKNTRQVRYFPSYFPSLTCFLGLYARLISMTIDLMMKVTMKMINKTELHYNLLNNLVIPLLLWMESVICKWLSFFASLILSVRWGKSIIIQIFSRFKICVGFDRKTPKNGPFQSKPSSKTAKNRRKPGFLADRREMLEKHLSMIFCLLVVLEGTKDLNLHSPSSTSTFLQETVT